MINYHSSMKFYVLLALSSEILRLVARRGSSSGYMSRQAPKIPSWEFCRFTEFF